MFKKFIKGILLLTMAALLFSVVPAFAAEGPTSQRLGLGIGKTYGSMKSVVADFLGLSEEEFVAARQSGKSVVDIAAEKGITKQELTDKVIEERTAVLNQLVAEEKITQEQANLCIENMKARVESNLERNSTGNPWQGKQGRGLGQGQGKGLGGSRGRSGAGCGRNCMNSL